MVRQSSDDDAVEIVLPAATPVVETKLSAYVSGAVQNPGVYTLVEGDRLLNLIDLAGGIGVLGVGHSVTAGDRIQFCRRDHNAAVKDLKRMLADVKRRSDGAPRAGLYYACVARGPNLFGSESEELRLIRDELGEFPLVGFFANGEISHDRLYGYTGVLALIL